MKVKLPSNLVDLDEWKKKKQEENGEESYWVYQEPDMDDLEAMEFLSALEMQSRPLVGELTEDESNKVLYVSLKASDDGLREIDGMSLLSWANKTILSYNLLCMTLNGQVSLLWDPEHEDVIVNPI